MDHSPSQLGDAGDGDALPDDLAALYRADAQHDVIDVDAGWTSLRPRLRGLLRQRRIAIFVAAAAVTSALAASLLFALRATPHVPPGQAVPALSSPAATTTRVIPDSSYLQVVADLERALHDGHDRLAPETAAAIDGSLAAIDRAIHDAQTALTADPANDYIAVWLETIRRRKVAALRQAVSDLSSAS